MAFLKSDLSLIASRFALTRRDDESSIQYISGTDRRFFLRVEMAKDGPPDITDLLPGDLSEMEQAEILAYVFEELGLTRHLTICFSNIQSSPRGDALQEAERLLRVTQLYAFRSSRFLVEHDIFDVGEKKELTLSFVHVK